MSRLSHMLIQFLVNFINFAAEWRILTYIPEKGNML